MALDEAAGIKNIALIGLRNTCCIESVLNCRKFRLIYILDDDQMKAEDLKRTWDLQYTILVPLDEADLMFEDKTVEGVIISQEVKMRKKWILKSLKANKSVLCDGSLGANLEEVQRCYEISQKVEKSLLTVDHLIRYQPFIDFKKQFLATKDVTIIKKITRGSSSVTNIIDALMQDVDILCWALEEYPEKVLGIAGYQNIENVEAIVVTLKFPKEPIIAIIDINLHEKYGEVHQLKFLGDGKYVTGSTDRGGKLIKKIGSNVTQKYSYNMKENFKDSYEQISQHFLETLRGDVKNVDERKTNILKCSQIVASITESLAKEKFILVNY